MANPTPVVFLAVADLKEQLDPFYARFFKPGTVVIRVQQPPAPDPYD